MKALVSAAAGLLAVPALVGAALAADLSRPPPAPYYSAPVAAPYYNWTGFYIGANGGYGWGSTNWDGYPASFNTSGGVVGGQLGYNWQFGQFVYGLEGDGDWSNIHGTTTVSGVCGASVCGTYNDFLATARGRVGVAFDRFLPYVTGGLAVGNIRAPVAGYSGIDQTNAGWTVGAGLEFAIGGNWTAKAEYLHVDLGSAPCGASCGLSLGSNDISFTADIVRGGINYRF